jgi:translocation and assembly module TamB
VSARRRLGIAAGVVVLIVAFATWLLLGSPAGARWLLGRVGGAVAGTLTAAEVEGSVLGPLTIHGLVYESDSLDVRVEELQLDWRPGALLRRRLDVATLDVRGVDVLLTGQEEESAAPPPLPTIDLPLDILVQSATLQDLEMTTAGAEPLIVDSVELSAHTAGERFVIERFDLRSPTLDADLNGGFVPRGDYPLDLRVAWSLRPEEPDGPAGWRGEGTLTGTLAELRAEQQLASPLAARIDARLRQPLSDLTFEATVEAQPFPLTALGADLPQVTVDGRLDVAGSPETFSVETDLAVQVRDLGPLRARAELDVAGRRWRIDRLTVTSPAAATRIVAAGRILLPAAADDGAAAEGAAAAERPDLDLEAAWTGLVWPLGDAPAVTSPRGELTLVGSFDAYELTIRGEIATPALPASPLELSARGGADGLFLERLDAAALDGGLRLTAEGAVLPELDLAVSLQAPDLAVLLAGGSGSLRADGRLSGPADRPRIELSVDGDSLVRGDLSIAALEIETDLDLAPDGRVRLGAEARGLTAGGRLFEAVELTLDGRREEHRLAASAAGGEGKGLESLRFTATGGRGADDIWRGELDGLDLVPAAAGGDWALAAPAALTAGAGGAELGQLCEVSGAARVCFGGSWSADAGWRAEASIEALPLSHAAALLPPELRLSGTLAGELSARGEPAARDADEGAGGGDTTAVLVEADLRPGPGELSYSLADGSTGALRFGAGTFAATVDGAGLAAELTLPLPELGSAGARLSLPGYSPAAATGGAQPIAAALSAEITDLAFLQAFSDRLDDITGRLHADLTVGGTLSRPHLGGEARLEEGGVSVPELGIRVTEISLLASPAPAAAAAEAGAAVGQSLRIEGSLRSGEGRLTLSGRAPATLAADDPIRIAIRGTRFEAMSSPEIQLLASPDLELTYDGDLLSISGDVQVPKARIEFDSPPASAVVPSEDVVYVGVEPPTEPPDTTPLALSLRVTLGDDVELEALGLTAEPSGSLLLVDEPGQPTTGTGQIDLAGGTFKAYGQDLTIERGRLVFRGPLDDPYVDLRAYRKAADGVTAGIEATGLLARPRITLWSDPPMDQADQLSYLLLGRPVDTASQSDGDLLTNAAASLGLKGGNLLVGRLATRFGLEEARIEADEGLEEARLVLGTYLSPRLYLAYGVGLFEAANTLRLRYLLSSKWTLEATTGVGTSTDLLYTIERGRGSRRRPPAVESEEGPAPGPIPADDGTLPQR